MQKIRNGLDIPISGSPEHKITDFKKPRSVALVGADYHGLKPSMLVKEGDRVKIGQPLFEDKKNNGVLFTSPGGGVIESVNRGDKRALQSVVIEIDESEEEESFVNIRTEYSLIEICYLYYPPIAPSDDAGILNDFPAGTFMEFKSFAFAIYHHKLGSP